MAHFRGTVQGGRGQGSRLGHASTGLSTTACGWGGKITTALYVNKDGGKDWAVVQQIDKDGGCYTLYSGPLNEHKPRSEWVEIPFKVEASMPKVRVTKEVSRGT